MTHVRVKLLIATVVLVGSVMVLAFAGARDGWVYYLDVDTYLENVDYHTKRVRLCGRVAEENLVAAPAKLTTTFDLVGPTQQLAVVYHGVVPDTFKAGVDVVLEGKMDDAGVFQADTLMTKCASKYQAEEHAKRLEQSP